MNSCNKSRHDSASSGTQALRRFAAANLLLRRATRSILSVAAALCAVSSFGQVFIPASSVPNQSKPWQVHSNYKVLTGKWNHTHIGKVTRSSSVSGYYPSDIRTAYGLPSTGGTEAIAVIEAYDYATALNDFNVFSGQFALPQETSTNPTASTNQVFQVIYASGTKPSANASWGGETALDMEWAHAMAPNAKIYVIECASENFSDVLVGVQIAASLPDVREVSMSFGTSEDSSENSYDSYFTSPNQVYFAAAGDTSNEMDYPAASPNVLGVGGTTLNFSGQTPIETAWTSSGGGPSSFEPLPQYQHGFTTGARGVPDIAADADPNTGCAIYDSTPVGHSQAGWQVFGGTSLATPICAGITNLRGSFSTTSYNELVRQYSLAGTSCFRDIVSGTSGKYSAGVGYDYITGLGSLTNLFPSATYAPASLTVIEGTPVSGIPQNVAVKDNHDYVIRSVPTASYVQSVTVGGTFTTLLTSGTSRVAGSISITGMTTGATATLSLYNYNTSNWDVISNLTLGSSSTTLNINITNINAYFDSNNNMQFTISCENQSSTPPVFRLGLDQVQLALTTLG